jgi:starch synthase
MKVLIATSEAVPFAKTGGLADVTGTLLNELRNEGVDARLILPLYRGIKGKFKLEDTGTVIEVPLGRQKHEARVFSHGETAYFIEHDDFFNRPELYGTRNGDYPDNAHRFIFFSRGVLEACSSMALAPDILHSNDWQTGLIPLYIKTLYRRGFEKTATVFTIHNLGYQGTFPPAAMTLTGLSSDWFTPSGIEFYDQINMLKAGVISADKITTVSPNYAKEILTKEYGAGLEGVLTERSRDLSGILNGLDYDAWDPSSDAVIPSRYSLGSFSGKMKCRRSLIRECSFKNPRAPVAGMVGRLSSQKGLDLFLESAGEIFASGANVAILGKGDGDVHRGLRAAEKKYEGRLYVNIGFDEDLARRIYAGSDIVMMPSHYEPCGLTQMIAMRYGAVPLARSTGGLADTIKDYNHLSRSGTGFLFSGRWPSAFAECVKRAVCVFSDGDRWSELQRRCMKQRFYWKTSARKYVGLYRKLSRTVSE